MLQTALMPHSREHCRAAPMGGYVNQLPLTCLAQDREQSIVMETEREVTGKSSGQNKWIICVNEHINACPDMFLSQPRACCEEAMFISLWNFCISIYLDWVNMHIYWYMSLKMVYVIYWEYMLWSISKWPSKSMQIKMRLHPQKASTAN